ncbi:MAG: response regulator transcription factor [Verrucomicrobiota bacterium]
MKNNLISDSCDSGGGVGVIANPATPINLWVVDDNRRIRDTMVELFGRCQGIHCTASFHSPNAVLSALASKVGPDVILLDMNLGEHNGIDAIRPIKSLSPATQVLMFTTFFDAECRTRALTSGASAFLLKSFPLEKIIDSIRQARCKPVPHLKKRPKVAVAQSAVNGGTDQQSAAPAVVSSRETPPRKHHLAWIKNCLDVIRAARN